jgi:hypothetical protein
MFLENGEVVTVGESVHKMKQNNLMITKADKGNTLIIIE